MKKLLSTTSLMILSLWSLGQFPTQELDSLKSMLPLDTLQPDKKYFVYQRIISLYKLGPYDSLVKYTNLVMDHCQQINEPKFLYAGTFLKARTFANMEQFDSAKYWYQESYGYAQAMEREDRMAKLDVEVGYLLMKQDSLLQSLDFLKRAEATFEKLDMPGDLHAVYDLIGSLMLRMERYSDAIAYRKRSLHVSQNRQDSALTYHNLYGAYALLKQYDSARWTLEKGLSLTPEGTGNYFLQLINYTHLYLEQEYDGFSPEKALQYMDTIQSDYLHLFGSRSDSLTIHLNSAGALIQLGKTQLAKEHLDIYEELLNRNPTKRDTYKYYWILSEYYKALGQYKQAYSYYFQYDTMKENYTDASTRNKLYLLSKSYELEKRDSQIQSLSFEKEKQELEASVFQKQRNGFIVFAVVLLIAGAVIVRQSVLRKKTNRLLEEKSLLLGTALSEKETLLKEIHHRVKNNLQVVSSLLNLQANDLTDAAADAIKEGQLRVKSMALIHQKLYQENDLTGIEVQGYLENLVTELFTSFGTNSDQIHYEVDAKKLKLDVDTLVPLGLIINELITNSLKYAFQKTHEGLLTIHMNEEDSKLKVIVSDNGVGMDTTSSNHTSFGWKMIKSLCRQLKADLDIATSAGTKVTLTVSRYKLIP